MNTAQTYTRICLKAAEHGFESLTEMEWEFIMEYTGIASSRGVC